MNYKLILTKELFLSNGTARDCYIHPLDPKKVLKIIRKNINKNPNLAEFKYFEYLKINSISQEYIAKCYGFINTNLGKALCFERILNYDNSISISLRDMILTKKFSQVFEEELIQNLRNYIFKNNILFLDIASTNVLCQEYKKNKFRLMIVDGLGVNRLSLKYYMSLKFKIYRNILINIKWKKFIKNINLKRREILN
ncbi:YrbL family protein [Aliarcobacter lanthieri]|uniref:YrbL family protein n=1 Tax=Aliarcobacter lanthieri TaxID=1355374 RepID=UPI00047DA802|nr:YrbL family protein [Aliarcobacter lanthieri]